MARKAIMSNIFLKRFSLLLVVSLCCAGLIFAGQAKGQASPQTPPAAPMPSPDSSALGQIIERVMAREAALTERMRNLHPVVETYIQSLDKDDDLTFKPKGDAYFLGKLDLKDQKKQQSMLDSGGIKKNVFGKLSQIYSVKYLPGGFAQMLVVGGHFERKEYDFEYIRREFIGEVRTIVIDCKPKKGGRGTFIGRIWVEDQAYNIVRFNGSYGPSTRTKMFFHFESWREFVGNGEWLPAYIYTEESNIGYLMGARKLRFKGQTRLWGYNVGKSNAQNELTSLKIESDHVNDTVDQAEALSPVRALRAWQRDAEDNVIQRLEKAALLAPDGEVNKVLETVATNLQITNNLNIEPEVRARVLLTAPMESFTIGHTIVLSRGLIDVLPDEASLAMIIAHELAHIALGHQIDTQYCIQRPDALQRSGSIAKDLPKRDDREEVEADKKASELLMNSPYKDKLANAGLFLKAVDERAGQLRRLLLPHIGNAMVKGSQSRRMVDLKETAPEAGNHQRRANRGSTAWRPRASRSVGQQHRNDEDQTRRADYSAREDAV